MFRKRVHKVLKHRALVRKLLHRLAPNGQPTTDEQSSKPDSAAVDAAKATALAFLAKKTGDAAVEVPQLVMIFQFIPLMMCL